MHMAKLNSILKMAVIYPDVFAWFYANAVILRIKAVIFLYIWKWIKIIFDLNMADRDILDIF